MSCLFESASRAKCLSGGVQHSLIFSLHTYLNVSCCQSYASSCYSSPLWFCTNNSQSLKLQVLINSDKVTQMAYQKKLYYNQNWIICPQGKNKKSQVRKCKAQTVLSTSKVFIVLNTEVPNVLQATIALCDITKNISSVKPSMPS